MKKLQLFIIIYSVLVASSVCAADFLITADFNGFFTDFGSMCQSALKVTRHSSLDKTFLFSERFGHLHITVDVGAPDVKSDIDIPEKSDIYDHEVRLVSSVFEIRRFYRRDTRRKCYSSFLRKRTDSEFRHHHQLGTGVRQSTISIAFGC